MSHCCPCASASSSTAPFFLPSIPDSSSCRSGSGGAFSAAVGRSKLRCGGGPRRGQATVAAGSKDGGSGGTAGGEKGEDDAPAFNPFGFVTDNPSSRSAIQLPAVPAEDGNVGQMLYVMPYMPRFVYLTSSSSDYRAGNHI
uniref:Uncharacterized protein n=1 Tax=Zea mays TaxID=4577 RepID=B6SQI0_MAIZE|nr:hypothetical protein [Zea mays]